MSSAEQTYIQSKVAADQWIGLKTNTAGSLSGYFWTNGDSAATYSNWAPNQPDFNNNANNNCVYLWTDRSYQWDNTDWCSGLKASTCKCPIMTSIDNGGATGYTSVPAGYEGVTEGTSCTATVGTAYGRCNDGTGTLASSGGATGFRACEAGTFSLAGSSLGCQKCAAGKSSSAAASSCMGKMRL